MKIDWKGLARSKKGGWILVGTALLGMLLIYLSTRGSPATVTESAQDVDKYRDDLEDKLSRVVSRITGEEAPEIFVSLEGSEEVVYADRTDQSDDRLENTEGGDSNRKQEKSDRKQNYILVEDADGGQKALVVTTLAPLVRGVVVVTECADRPAIRERILQAITTALNIPSNKVCVVGVNHEEDDW